VEAKEFDHIESAQPVSASIADHPGRLQATRRCYARQMLSKHVRCVQSSSETRGKDFDCLADDDDGATRSSRPKSSVDTRTLLPARVKTINHARYR
jgi:hypothetical protein